MLVSYRWLREHLPGLEATPDEVAKLLSGAGLTVDAVSRPGATFSSLVVASVEEVRPHPSLDRVRRVRVNRGSEAIEILCGADNVPAPGGRVVLAPLGTELPHAGFTIRPRKIGGVLSEGMLVSETELGLAPDSQGILVLDDSIEVGTPFLEACPEADDTIFEVDVTPNRPDALGHVGIARDLGALLKLDFQLPRVDAFAEVDDRTLESLVQIEVEDAERCPHYGAAAVLGVRIAPSPDFMRWRLFRLGVRAISNVVDVTNWLLLQFGQPLHAFDLDFLRGHRILVRRARADEPFTTLDGIDRNLDPDDLVICDGEGPVALAGVMGGKDSEIRDDTQDVLLECAYFTPRGIRRTARRHGMHTESSHRFERGTDWGGVELVLEHAKALLVGLAGGRAVRGALHVESPPSLPTVKLRSNRLDELLGTRVPFDEAVASLERLGFPVLERGEDQATFEGASHRPDVSIEVDLIEEVARLRGLEDIPVVLPRILPQAPRKTGLLERETVAAAVSMGLSEALTYAFVSRADLRSVKAPLPVVALDNPLSEDRDVQRTSLLPGLLDAVRRARRRGEPRATLFSVGAVFLPPCTQQSPHAQQARPRLEGDQAELPEERPTFCAVLSGQRREYLSLRPSDFDVFDAKGLAVSVIKRLTGRRAHVEHVGATERTAHLHPRGASFVQVEGHRVGQLGPLHPNVAEALGIDGSLQVVEIDLTELELLGKRIPQFQPIPKLPAVTRDLSLVVPDSVSAGSVRNAVLSAAGELCEQVELTSVFRGGSVPDGHVSLTFHLVYRDPKSRTDVDNARTLTDKEVDQQQAKVLERAQNEFGATLRG